MVRYYVYDYLISGLLLIDTATDEIIYYRINLYGQLVDLIEGGRIYKITNRKKNSLIKQLQSGRYSIQNGAAVDPFIYKYLLSKENRNKIGYMLEVPKCNELIMSGNDFYDLVEKMCEWAYEHHYSHLESRKNQDKSKLTRYCKNYLSKFAKVVNQ